MRPELRPARRAAARAGLRLAAMLGALPALLGVARAAPPPAAEGAVASASAPARATVALSGDPADATFQRVRDELLALGVRITTGGPGEADAREGADARVVVARRRATIALAARHGGGELEVAVRRGDGPEVLALAAVELLRARLLHRDAPAAPPPTGAAPAGSQDPPPSKAGPASGPSAGPAASATTTTATSPAPSAVRAPASRPTTRSQPADGASPPARLVASVGPTLLFAFGDVPLTPALSIGGTAIFRGWYVAAGGTTTLGGTSWKVPGGWIEHGVTLVGATAGGALSFAGGHGLATLGAGASALRLDYDARVESPVWDGLSGTSWAAVPHLEAAARWFIHDHAGLRLGGLAGAALPSIDIPYPERIVGSAGPADATGYGRLLLAVSLSLEARL
ncbi:hypothetical protein [Sorangium cellulosum]|uniref:hypothetical protein n=1 Tax=Sorangium cellulosum TaxID=56 RepID=UPI00041B25F3|nr:hypothetical protein [Sorangium cellulosum]